MGVRNPQAQRTQGIELGEPLSAQERWVLKHSCAGFADKQIATIVNRSPRTIEAYIAKSMRKLGAGNRIHLGYIICGMPEIVNNQENPFEVNTVQQIDEEEQEIEIELSDNVPIKCSITQIPAEFCTCQFHGRANRNA